MSWQWRNFPCWGLALLMLAACATSPEQQTREDRVRAKEERSLAMVFGASGAAFSPSGSKVAVANREHVWVADTDSGQLIARLTSADEAPFGGRKSLEFINEQRLVIASQGSILIWDLKEELVAHRLLMPSQLETPRALAWSEATKTLAFSSGISNGSVNVVSVKPDGFGPVQLVPGFEGILGDLAFSRDGRYLAVTGDDSGVNIREVASGKFIGELPTEGFVSSLETFGDDKLLVSGANVGVWSFLSEEEQQQFEDPGQQGQIDGQMAKRAGSPFAEGVLTMIALPIDILFQELNLNVVGWVNKDARVGIIPLEEAAQPWCGRSNSISPDGQWLADIYPGYATEFIGIYNMGSSKKYWDLNPKGEYSCVVKFSPNGRQLLITSNEVARLYDTKTWKHIDLDLGKP